MRLRRIALSSLLAALIGSVIAPAVLAASPVTLTATARLGGNARVGSWMEISVHVVNTGPAIVGELRMPGGSSGRTRFGVAADLPTGSDKTFSLFAQPPAFGRELEITLVAGDQTVASTKAAFTIHDANQQMVGVVAERPGDLISEIHLLPNQNQVAPALLPLAVTDLPSRVEAWGALDRIVWQDLDSDQLTTEQRAALRAWIAGGGRLVIVGGTAGPGALSGFDDDLLPYRPSATIDVAASSLGGLVGEIPTGTADVPALGGTLSGGRTLLSSGDRVIAAERPYGNGAVTVIGFDPTASWIAGGKGADALWRSVLPSRASGGLVIGDDSQLLQAVSQLPSLALPPIGGLFALLAAYILLIGPINYLVLRRLDRREWAWVTMPLLIGGFAVAAYVFGSLLRGGDVLVNEVALVRGAPGATIGTAQVYVGVFSPTRGTYQVGIPGGALVSAPVSGDTFGGDPNASALDIVQGDPARVRDLAVGFGSLRSFRADSPVQVPLVQADLKLDGGRLTGTIKNASTSKLLKPAVVLGSSVAVLADLDPGATADVDLGVAPVQFGQPLSDRVVGPIFFDGSGGQSDLYVRHTMVDQLTFDPNTGTSGSLGADGAVILAWGDGALVPVDITGQQPRATGTVLYYLPTDVRVTGSTTFSNQLIRPTVVASDGANFSKDPSTMYFGRGSATVSYRPIAFSGTFDATALTLGLNFGPDQPIAGTATPVEPLASIPPSCTDPPTNGCVQAGFDGMPEVEVFDRDGSTWRRLPHFSAGSRYSLAEAARYVDPASGAVLIRFVNDRNDGVSFAFDITLAGNVR